MNLNTRSSDASVAFLDFNATTPVDPAVLEAMLPYFTDESGNASSTHAWGRRASEAVEGARAQVADAVGASPGSFIFTSGATESNNLALVGLWRAELMKPRPRRRVITVATEHKAVLEVVTGELAPSGADVVILGVDSNGAVDLAELRDALRTPTLLVSAMAANNETGVLMPLRAIADLAHEAGALVHSDAAQVVGKTAFDVRDVDVDLASISAHKMYGPKGIGGLYLAGGVRLEPILRGGGHERGLRSGTSNTPSIVGFGVAARLAKERMRADADRMETLRDQLWEQIAHVIPESRRNGPAAGVLPNTLNVRLSGIDADDLLAATPRLGAATGSACAAGSPEPSHVLLAMGLSYDEARASLRFSVGRTTDAADIDAGLGLLRDGHERVRQAA
jgi:cysteine desulfurase